jgi:hypothetical protein
MSDYVDDGRPLPGEEYVAPTDQDDIYLYYHQGFVRLEISDARGPRPTVAFTPATARWLASHLGGMADEVDYDPRG